MTRSRPRYGWHALPDNREPAFSEGQLAEILPTFQHRITEPRDAKVERVISDLQRIGSWYLVAQHQHRMPTNAEVLASLKKLADLARRLASQISIFDDVTVEALLQQEGYLRHLARLTEESAFDAQRIREGFESIALLAEEAEKAAEWVEERIRSPDARFRLKLPSFVKRPFRSNRANRVPTFLLIKKLANLFAEATGEEPRVIHNRTSDEYSGDFHDLVKSVFERLRDARASGGLGRTIDEALAERQRAILEAGRENART